MHRDPLASGANIWGTQGLEGMDAQGPRSFWLGADGSRGQGLHVLEGPWGRCCGPVFAMFGVGARMFVEDRA